MDKLSVYDAKAHFSEVIERAQSGRSTVITKRGCVVAIVVPAKESAWDRSAVLDEDRVERFRLRRLICSAGCRRVLNCGGTSRK